MEPITIALLNEEFDKHSSQLKSFLLPITASLRDAKDIVHDIYVKAVDKRASFRGGSTFKTWQFAIASNLAKDNLRARARWIENVTDIARAAALADKDFLQQSAGPPRIPLAGGMNSRRAFAVVLGCMSRR